MRLFLTRLFLSAIVIIIAAMSIVWIWTTPAFADGQEGDFIPVYHAPVIETVEKITLDDVWDALVPQIITQRKSPFACYALNPYIAGSAVASGSCTPTTVSAEQTLDDSVFSLHGDRKMLQKFRVSTAGDRCSVTFSVDTFRTAGNIDIRLDDDNDLSADTLATDTVAISSATTYEVVFDVALSTGQDYFVGIQFSQAEYVDRLSVDMYNASDQYDCSSESGSNCDLYQELTGSGWDTWTQQAGDDWYFQVKVCSN